MNTKIPPDIHACAKRHVFAAFNVAKPKNTARRVRDCRPTRMLSSACLFVCVWGVVHEQGQRTAIYRPRLQTSHAAGGAAAIAVAARSPKRLTGSRRWPSDLENGKCAWVLWTGGVSRIVGHLPSGNHHHHPSPSAAMHLNLCDSCIMQDIENVPTLAKSGIAVKPYSLYCWILTTCTVERMSDRCDADNTDCVYCIHWVAHTRTHAHTHVHTIEHEHENKIPPKTHTTEYAALTTRFTLIDYCGWASRRRAMRAVRQHARSQGVRVRIAPSSRFPNSARALVDVFISAHVCV